MNKKIKLVKKAFDKRNIEISNYLLLLKWFNSSRETLNNVKLKYFVIDDITLKLWYREKFIDWGLSKTLNWLMYLLLYNLIEWTMYLLINKIYDELLESKIEISDLNNALFKEINSRFKKNISKKSLKKIIDKWLPEWIYSILWERRNWEVKYYNFNWNVDHEVIVDVAKSFWFSYSVNGKIRDFKNKIIVLNQIKNARNQLAHWNKSFSDMSDHQHLNQNNIEEMHLIVKVYLWEIIKNVDHYLKWKKYLR